MHIGGVKTGYLHRAVFVLAYLGVVGAMAVGVWRYGYVQGLTQLAQRGQADLALASDRLVGQLQRYRDLAVTMADHPQVVQALTDGATQDTRFLLLDAADRSATLDVMIIDRQGDVVAAAQSPLSGAPASVAPASVAPIKLSDVQAGNQAQPAQAVARAPYVRRALRGALGWGHGPAEPLTQRAFYHAAPVFDSKGRVQGAVLVVTDLNGIDYNWRGTNPASFFTDAKGVVLISNRSELLFWQRPEGSAGLLPPKGPAPEFASDYWGAHEIWTLGWGPYLPREALHQTQDLPVIGLTGEVLLDVSQTRALAWAQMAAFVGLCLAFGSLLYFAAERRRTLALANAQLEVRVAQRTQALREANAQLRLEAAEREEAQTALKQAQGELVQAGKLSALGQMSAGISHELNQPLMAIRSFAENAQQFLDRDKPVRAAENLSRISDMSQRMGRIIRNLRAFARQEDTAQDRVDLCRALEAALDLTRGYAADAGVTLDAHLPQAPLWVRGGEVRLGQVFVNLITNAVDAMAESVEKRLHISVRVHDSSPQDGPLPILSVEFRDTGPGIEMPDKVFDPFYTTKEVGQTGGMGLGLSISYGIVQSFGGQIKGSNVDGGGALFSVTLEPAQAMEDAS